MSPSLKSKLKGVRARRERRLTIGEVQAGLTHLLRLLRKKEMSEQRKEKGAKKIEALRKN